MNILQRIFTDYYEVIKYTLHPRKTEMENIDKMINCGNPSFGGAMYICAHCKNWKFVPFRCHSRFCPTCGNKYAMERTTSMSFKLINVKHRHCVFTIDENLRDFFLHDRSLLNCLFHAVNSVISRMFFQMNKSKNFTPGFIMVLHSFGRDLKWNPHIHCLISEGGFSDDGFWRHINHFNYTYLRNAFRTVVLCQEKVQIKCNHFSLCLAKLNLLFLSHFLLNFSDILPHIGLGINTRNGCEYVLYCKMFLCIQKSTYMHVYN